MKPYRIYLTSVIVVRTARTLQSALAKGAADQMACIPVLVSVCRGRYSHPWTCGRSSYASSSEPLKSDFSTLLPVFVLSIPVGSHRWLAFIRHKGTLVYLVFFL